MNKPILLLSLTLAPSLVALSGCDDPAEGTVRATVTDEAAPEPAAPAEREESLDIDVSRSTLGFVGSKVTASHEGSFTRWSGTMSLDPAEVTASSVSIEIEMASIQADSERLTGHLRSADFFDVENIPTASFESSRIVEAPAGTEGDATHLVTGSLTLHGQTRTITFPARIEVSPAEVRGRARFVIDRQDFGIVYTGMADDLIRDQVVIHFDVRAPREA